MDSRDTPVSGDFSRSFWRTAPVAGVDLPDLTSTNPPLSEFELLADNIPTLCWIANGDGYIVWYNRRWHEYCGTTAEEMEGWGWQSVHDPDLLPAVMKRWTDSIETGEPFEMIFPLRGADGVFRPFLTRVQPLQDPSGKTVRWFGVNTEISKQVATEHQLQEASERVELALNAGAIAGTWVWDIPNDRFTGDERFARSFGLDPQQCREGVALSVAIDSIYPEDLPHVDALLQKALMHGGDYRAEYRVRQRDGEYRWVEAVGRCELDAEGRPLRFPGVLVDIDLRKKDEAALAESEARFREVANAAPVLIWVADTRNKGVWYNKAWLDFTGRSMDQELGDGWLDGVHPEDLARCAEICGGSFDRREPFRLDFRLRRADGEWRIIDDTGVPRFAEDGKFLGFIGSCVDVTEARRSEAALRASEEKYRRIFEQTSDLIFTTDLDQVITACNPAGAAAVGVARDGAIGRNISDFVAPEDLELTRQMLQRKLEQGGTTRYELRVRGAGGDWRCWEINSGLTFDEMGSPVGLHVVGRDITERKRLERHQQILVAELNHRVKNTLAIVQSLAHQTFRNDASPEATIVAFEGRLKALAVAHNLLSVQNWEAASIGDVIRSALAPFCPGDRCEAVGPEVKLPPETAVSLTLAIHELATNASKYGALANESGSVAITWNVADGRFELLWRERGGPPVVAPKKPGFGTNMIRRTLAAEFNGVVQLNFAEAGLECRVAGPVPAAITAAVNSTADTA